MADLTELLERLNEAPAVARARRAWNGRSGAPARLVVAFGALYVVLSVLLRHHKPPLGVFVYGAIVGLLYAMVAFGLILIHRANRIINFAQAEMGAAPAVLAVLLMKVHHVPWVLALLIAVGTGVVSGLLVELLIVRRFYRAPRLILSVATIGLALVFGAFQFYMPKWVGGAFNLDPTPPRTPFSSLSFTIGGVIFNGNHIVVLVGAAVVVIGLTLFFRVTDVGIAARASAENADRASLLGIPVKRVSTVVWMLGVGLASLAVFLRIPVIGLPIGVDVGPVVLLYALAAAVIARMESFGVALFAGIAIGVLEQSLNFFSRDPSVASALMLPILLVAMLVQRTSLSRGQDTGLSTWAQAREFRPIPPELRRLPQVVWTRFGLGVLVLAAVVAFPFLAGGGDVLIAPVVLIYGIVAVSLVILTGWAGQISLGQWGFAGAGAAVAGSLAARHNADFFVALLAAGLAGALLSVVIGLPALRIQGLYLAVTTLAFAVMVQVYLISPNYFASILPTHAQRIERPNLYGRYSLVGPRAFYFACLVALVLALASARALRRSRTGRVMIAARDNERGAQSYGVSVPAARLAAFAISGFWAALAGGLFVYDQGRIDTLSYAPEISLLLLTMVVIGGLTSLPGALLGTLWLGFLKYGPLSGSPTGQLLASGIGVLVLLLVLPGGLAQVFYQSRDGLLRALALRLKLRVPSLVADDRVEALEEQREAAALTLAATSVEQARVGSLIDAENGRTPPGRDGDAIVCPTCRERVALADATGHEHFVGAPG